MKFSPVVDLGPRATPKNFGDDPDPDEYSGSKASLKFFVRLSVCGQDFSETAGWIFMKFSTEVDLGLSVTP